MDTKEDIPNNTVDPRTAKLNIVQPVAKRNFPARFPGITAGAKSNLPLAEQAELNALISTLGGQNSKTIANIGNSTTTRPAAQPDIPLPSQLIRTESQALAKPSEGTVGVVNYFAPPPTKSSADPKGDEQKKVGNATAADSGQKPLNGSQNPSIPSQKPSSTEASTVSQTPSNITQQPALTNSQLTQLLSSLLLTQQTGDNKKRKVGWQPSIADASRSGATVVSNGSVVRGDPSAVMEEGFGNRSGREGAEGGDSDEESEGYEEGDGEPEDDIDLLAAAIADLGRKQDVTAVAVIKVEKAMVALDERMAAMLGFLTRIGRSGQ